MKMVGRGISLRRRQETWDEGVDTEGQGTRSKGKTVADTARR